MLCSVWCQFVSFSLQAVCSSSPSGISSTEPSNTKSTLPAGSWEICEGCGQKSWQSMNAQWPLWNNTAQQMWKQQQQRKLCTESLSATENDHSNKVMLGFPLRVADCSGSSHLPVSVARGRGILITTSTLRSHGARASGGKSSESRFQNSHRSLAYLTAHWRFQDQETASGLVYWFWMIFWSVSSMIGILYYESGVHQCPPSHSFSMFLLIRNPMNGWSHAHCKENMFNMFWLESENPDNPDVFLCFFLKLVIPLYTSI